MEGNGKGVPSAGVADTRFNEALPLWKGMGSGAFEVLSEQVTASMRPFLYGREWGFLLLDGGHGICWLQ